jgi:hypothetical protein
MGTAEEEEDAIDGVVGPLGWGMLTTTVDGGNLHLKMNARINLVHAILCSTVSGLSEPIAVCQIP